jgi:peroxiredoxin
VTRALTRSSLAVAGGLLLSAVAGASPPAVGSKVPDFQAVAFGGETVALREAAARHKAVVLLFVSTVCPYANYFAGHLKALAETYEPRGVLFVGIYSNGWESRDEAAAHAREHGFAFPSIKDEGHSIADAVGATTTPEALVVDASGRLRYRGRVMSKPETPELKHALEAVLAGKPVRTPLTKAFGCAIGG